MACRTLGGAIHTSLHESGQWHVAFERPFFEAHVDDSTMRRKGRFIEKWPRPTPIAPGLLLAYRIVTPESSVTIPYDARHFPATVWIPSAQTGMATEACIFLTLPDVKCTGWPGKNHGTSLVGTIDVAGGGRAWVVYKEVAMPNIDLSKQGPPRYFRGTSAADFVGPNLRAFVFGSEPDGSRTLFDFVVEDRVCS